MTKDIILLAFISAGGFVLVSIWVMYKLSLRDTAEKTDPLEEYLKRVKRNSKRVKL